MINNFLKENFGIESFQSHQEDAIAQILSGRDVLNLMPTGGGKSLCYQYPALLFKGITLVISPLIALMKDQVDGLKRKGIGAEFLNSSLSKVDVALIKRELRSGRIKLLYVSPERLASKSFVKFLSTLPVNFIAIDEAHCISQWGHDFRPEYLQIKKIRDIFPQAPMMALTATATEAVRDDIVWHLGLRIPSVFISSFNRPNLYFGVHQSPTLFEDLIYLLVARGNIGGVIIYCHSRKNTMDMAESLNLRGFKAEAYHAGLENDTRAWIQERFLNNEISIITATSAFGMGINKPDIRLVVHFCLPGSLEAYYQETGRAGRDGEHAQCFLFYDPKANIRYDVFIEKIEDIQHAILVKRKMVKMIRFCETKECRRKFLLEYFGESFHVEQCRNCDNCFKSPKKATNDRVMIPPLK